MARNTNLEILRAVSMLFVVLAHVLTWGTTHCIPNGKATFSNGHIINALSYPFLTSLSCMGVICFVAISSYFLCTSTTLRIKGIVRTWSVTLFYSVCTTLCCMYVRGGDMQICCDAFFPIWSDQYWFVTKYISLLLLAPFLAIFVNSISQKSLIISIVVWSCLTTTVTCGIPYGNVVFPDNPFSLAPFILIFLIVAYIRLYNLPAFFEKNSGKTFFLFIALQGIGGIGLNYIHATSGAIIGGFSNGYNALSLIPGIALFVWFKNHQFSGLTSRISKIGPYVFAVYLIHDNPNFRDILWNGIIDCAPYWDSPLWLLLALGLPMVIVVLCCIVDMFRTKLFGIVGINKLIERTSKYNIQIETK